MKILLVIHMHKIAHILYEKIDHAVPTQILRKSSYFVSSRTIIYEFTLRSEYIGVCTLICTYALLHKLYNSYIYFLYCNVHIHFRY